MLSHLRMGTAIIVFLIMVGACVVGSVASLVFALSRWRASILAIVVSGCTLAFGIVLLLDSATPTLPDPLRRLFYLTAFAGLFGTARWFYCRYIRPTA